MRCPKCQTDNPEVRKFCRECGARLTIACSYCGFENFLRDKFCGECGRDLRETGGTSVIDYERPQTYKPKFLADKILTTRSSIRRERKLVTAVFVDMVNYTAMSEKLDHRPGGGCRLLVVSCKTRSIRISFFFVFSPFSCFRN